MSDPSLTAPPVTVPLWKKPWAIALAVIVLIGVVVAIVFLARPASGNATACDLYESAYNHIADTARSVNNGGGATRDDAIAEINSAPSRFKNASDRAEGKVAVAMSDTLEYINAYSADHSSADAGTAFFISAQMVKDACAADGAPIDLHKLK